IEVVIIDDGSTDASGALVSQYLAQRRHPRVVFTSQANGGIAHARNVGLRLATGRYITFLDGDDLLSDDYLAILRPQLT
ncbi:glycosyltransferase family A protein, partial [Proteus mirabilis]